MAAKNTYSNLSIFREIQLINRNYSSSISIVEGLLFNQKKLIRTIEFYSNSKYLGSMQDELGREKPFFNIENAMCDVENAAKDIDTKDITATSDDGNHYTESFLLTKDIYEWMKEVNFAKTLNDMRDTHTRYGSLLVKKCIKKGKDGTKNIYIEMPEWKNVITDQVDIINSPIIECHFMTLADIMDMPDWYNLDELMSASKKYGYNSRIPVFEVRGWFPKSFISEMDAETPNMDVSKEFSYQLYHFACPFSRESASQTSLTDSNYLLGGKMIPLYWEDDTEECYKYLARKKRAGRAFGVGVMEEGEEAQVWTNDVVLKQFRAMEYTTKVVGQTASKRLKGRNMLNEVDDGQILEHEDQKPITALSLLPSGGLNQYPALIAQWFTQFERTTSAYSAQRGESPSSRTSAKLQSAVIGQSSSVMNNIKEELGIFVTEIFEDWIMPYLGTQLNAEHILAHDFSMAELKEIDKNFSISRANDMAKEAILSGKIVTPEDYDKMMQGGIEMIQRTKATRFLDLPKNYYKKVKPKITINVTGEQRDKEATQGVLLNLMKIYQGNPALINDPVLTQLFMKIVELSGSGISPLNLIGAFQEKAAQMAKEKGGGGKISESINFKDLPEDGKIQMAEQAGITLKAAPTIDPTNPPAKPVAASAQ